MQTLLLAIATATHPVHIHALGKQWDLVHWPARMLERQAALTALAAHRRNGVGVGAPNLNLAASDVSARDALKKRTTGGGTASLHTQMSAKVAVAVALPLTPDAAVIEAQRVAAALATEQTRKEVESDLREPEVRWRNQISRTQSAHRDAALCVCCAYSSFPRPLQFCLTRVLLCVPCCSLSLGSLCLGCIVRFGCVHCPARRLVCARSICRATNLTALAPRYHLCFTVSQFISSFLSAFHICIVFSSFFSLSLTCSPLSLSDLICNVGSCFCHNF